MMAVGSSSPIPKVGLFKLTKLFSSVVPKLDGDFTEFPEDSVVLIFIAESVEALGLDETATAVEILEFILASSQDAEGNM